jgi:hypothetical protein
MTKFCPLTTAMIMVTNVTINSDQSAYKAAELTMGHDLVLIGIDLIAVFLRILWVHQNTRYSLTTNNSDPT